MALTNAYCTLSDVKNALAIEDINDDLAIEAAIAAACRMIDDYTGRFFYKDGTTAAPVIRYYTPNDWWICNLDDFVSISEIATDENFDRSYTTVWSATALPDLERAMQPKLEKRIKHGTNKRLLHPIGCQECSCNRGHQ